MAMRFANTFKANTPWGQGLQNLAGALFSGQQTPAMQAKQQRDIETQALERDLRAAQADKVRAETGAIERQASEQAAVPSRFVESFGLPPQETLTYLRGQKVTEPVPFDDEGNPMPMAPAPRPDALTPESESTIRSVLRNLALQSGLSGKTNLPQFQSALGQEMENQGFQDALTSPSAAEALAQAVYAREGKAPFTESQGRVFSPLTGSLDESGGTAQAGIGKLAAAAQADRARAGTEGARQGLLRAQADRTRALPMPALKPPPGSLTPAQQLKQDAVLKKEAKQRREVISALDKEIEVIDKLIGNAERVDEAGKPAPTRPHPGLGSMTGPIMTRLPTLRTSTANAEALHDSLLSKSSLSALQSIRGSGTLLGSMTEKEWPILQNYKATLQRTQGTAQFKDELANYRRELVRVKQNVLDASDAPVAPATGAPQAGAPVQISSDEEWDALAPGTEFIAPDGSLRVK